jgi:hypothetical protein
MEIENVAKIKRNMKAKELKKDKKLMFSSLHLHIISVSFIVPQSFRFITYE